MIAEVEGRLDEIAALCQRYGVRRLDLFGSAATGVFDPLTSHIDFLGEYPKDHDLGLWLDQYLALRDDVNQCREVIYDAATVTAMAG